MSNIDRASISRPVARPVLFDRNVFFSCRRQWSLIHKEKRRDGDVNRIPDYDTFVSPSGIYRVIENHLDDFNNVWIVRRIPIFIINFEKNLLYIMYTIQYLLYFINMHNNNRSIFVIN